MNYQNFITIPGGLSVKISENGGFVVRGEGHILLLFAQNDPIFRIERGTTESYATFEFTRTSGSSQSFANVSFSVSEVQYLPVRSLIMPLIDRKKTSYAEGIEAGGTLGELSFGGFTENGDSTGHVSLIVYMCDCGGVAQTIDDTPFENAFPLSINLPDTFRWFDGDYAEGFNLATVRAKNGAEVVRQLYASSSSAKTYSIGGRLGLPVGLSWQQGVTSIATYSGGTMYEEARVITVPQDSCPERRLHVYWWSNEHGGWKSRVADIVRPYTETVRTLNYLKSFDRREGREVRGGVLCRFENLTLRDMLYYRDLYSSDEVYIYTNRISAGGSGIGSVAAIVRGEPPIFKPTGAVDFEFYLEIERYDSI